MPVFSQLLINGAGRYDRYEYSSNSSGKATYALGFEYRPFKPLLLRGSVATGFRAPDLSYLYAGENGSSSSGTDYYLCRRDEPETGPNYYDGCSNGDVGFNGRSHGSTALGNETSTSFTYGFVYSPMLNLDFTPRLLQHQGEERGHLPGQRQSAAPGSGLPFRDDRRRQAGGRQFVVLPAGRKSGGAQFTQRAFNPNGITSVLALPINAAMDYTSGYDFDSHYRLVTDGLGEFSFHLGGTYVIKRRSQLSPDSPVDNQMTDLYYYLIPRTKANASVTWNYRDFTATVYGARLGGIPDYDGTKRLSPTSEYNTTFAYRITPALNVSLIINNVLDKRPRRDETWTSYPYYYIPGQPDRPRLSSSKRA